MLITPPLIVEGFLCFTPSNVWCEHIIEKILKFRLEKWDVPKSRPYEYVMTMSF